MIRALTAAFVSVLMVLSSAPVRAEGGTREEAIQMVKRVQEKFARDGAEAAFSAITTTAEFKDRDLYPFVYTLDGWNVAHGANPKMVGKLWISTKDQDGNYLIQQMVAVSQNPGHGWVNYKWPHPITHRIEDKSAYIEKLGDKYFVGVGVYP
jgi:signal transduction histidine kinase